MALSFHSRAVKSFLRAILFQSLDVATEEQFKKKTLKKWMSRVIPVHGPKLTHHVLHQSHFLFLLPLGRGRGVWVIVSQHKYF